MQGCVILAEINTDHSRNLAYSEKNHQNPVSENGYTAYVYVTALWANLVSWSKRKKACLSDKSCAIFLIDIDTNRVQ